MSYKSNLGASFRNSFAETIFKQKYQHQGAMTWEELSDTVVEDVCRDKLSKEDKAQLKQYIREMKFIPGGRYLYYAGRNKKYFNNCFIFISKEDSRENWANLSWKAESCLTTGGGIGNDYSIYRGKNSILHGTGGQASGPISKMKMINEIGREVMQGGSRRSAIYASLNWQHSDIRDFLVCKDWYNMPVAGTDKSLGQLKEADFNFPCPLDMTNISTNYDTKWLLNYWSTGELTDIFLTNCRQAMMTGEPGFAFNMFDKENETGRNACVTGDTSLLTKELGYVPISNVVGKEVTIWNGWRWSKVVPFSTGVNPVLLVKFSDGNEIRCTPYHKFVLADDNRVCADELRVGDRLYKHRMPVDEEGKDYNVDAYSQGFYSGDGNKDHSWSWIYNTKYSCISRLIGSFSEENNNRVTWKHGEMFPKDFVPVNANLQYRLNWLAGLCDSDGTVTRDINGNGIQIGSINRKFLFKTKLMLSRMGIRAKLVVNNNSEGFKLMPDGKGGSKEYYCQQAYRLLIGNEDTYSLLQLGFKANRLQLHSNKPQRDARRFVTVTEVIDLGVKRKTYCVNEPDQNLVTFNGMVTGNCTEVTTADDSDVCNLGSLNLSRITSINEFKDVVELATKFLVCGTLVADLPYDQVYWVREKNRRLGLGLMGLHEWLLQRGYRYEVTPELHRWLTVYRDCSRHTADTFSSAINVSRPVACRAIAPTGSIGIISSTTTGIEPVYAVAVKRRYLKGTAWKYQYVIDGTAKEFIEKYSVAPESIESSVDLSKNFERRIKFQADVQDYVDMGISSTINLPKWGSEHNNEDKVKEFANTLAKYAHRLRGFTVYPDSARGGQPLVSVPYSEAIDKLGVELEENTQMFDVCDITGKGGSCGT